MRLTGGEGIDLAIDALGPGSSARTTGCSRPGGRAGPVRPLENSKEGKRAIPLTLKSL